MALLVEIYASIHSRHAGTAQSLESVVENACGLLRGESSLAWNKGGQVCSSS